MLQICKPVSSHNSGNPSVMITAKTRSMLFDSFSATFRYKTKTAEKEKAKVTERFYVAIAVAYI